MPYDDSPSNHGIKCLKQIRISKVNYELRQKRSSDRKRGRGIIIIIVIIIIIIIIITRTRRTRRKRRTFISFWNCSVEG